MLSCGIPELSDLDDLKYVYDALRPHETEADATMYFTRSDAPKIKKYNFLKLKM